MFEIVLLILTVLMIVSGSMLFLRAMGYRQSVLNDTVRPVEVLDKRLPNWAALCLEISGQKEDAAKRLCQVVAKELHSDACFLLARAKDDRSRLVVPSGWLYSENEFPTQVSISADDEFVTGVLSEDSFVIGDKMGKEIPESLAKVGIKSGILASVGYPARKFIFVVCNSTSLPGKPPFEVRYTLKDRKLVEAIAKVLSLQDLEIT